MSNNTKITKLESRIQQIINRPGYSSGPAWKQEVAELRLQIESLRTGRDIARVSYERPRVQPTGAAAAETEAESTDDSGHHEDHGIRPYMVIFGWLIFLTLLEVGAGEFVKGYTLWAALSIMAVVKALFVALYYMHLQSEQPAMKGLLMLPVVLIVAFFMLILPDAVNFLENYW